MHEVLHPPTAPGPPPDARQALLESILSHVRAARNELHRLPALCEDGDEVRALLDGELGVEVRAFLHDYRTVGSRPIVAPLSAWSSNPVLDSDASPTLTSGDAGAMIVSFPEDTPSGPRGARGD